MEAHNYYADLYQNYAVEKRPQLNDYPAFRNHWLIDCSNMKSSLVDITLHIEEKEEFLDKTKTFWLFIHDCLMEYLQPREVSRSLN